MNAKDWMGCMLFVQTSATLDRLSFGR